jgi:hypothetical protein
MLMDLTKYIEKTWITSSVWPVHSWSVLCALPVHTTTSRGLPSTYCSHWLNRSRCVVLTCLRCSFFCLPWETSWIWIGRRLASSISNGVKTGKKVNGPHQVHRKDVDHHLRLASSLVVSFYAPYPYFFSRLKYILFTVPTYAACTWV